MNFKQFLLASCALVIAATSATAQIPSYVPTDGLDAWYSFNGNANDESANGNNGILYGATLTSDRFGNPNGAYSFNGLGNYIQLPSTFLGGVQVSSFTMHSSFKVDNFPNTQGWGQNVWGKNLFWGEVNMEVFPDSSVRLFFANNYSGNKYSVAYSSIGSLHSNRWHNVDIVYQNSVATIYIDGVQVPTSLLWYSQSGATLSTSQIESVCNFAAAANSCRFGTRNVGGVWGSYLDGIIDEFGIWNRALTPQEIQNLYNGTTETVDTGNGAAPLPQGIPYQAAARDAQGQVIADAAVNVRFTLHEGAADGAASYAETHALTTNSVGLFNTVFGAGTPEQSAFDSINWAATTKFLQVEIDLGEGYVDMGTTQLLSVPYALRSDEAARLKNAGLPIFNDNAAALAGGLVAGEMYRTSAGVLMIAY